MPLPRPPTRSSSEARAPRKVAAPPSAAGADVVAPSTQVDLRLAIGSGGIGIELGEPVRLGAVVVTELAWNIGPARFPLDVSGGVSRFRHRRGRLDRLALELPRSELGSYVAATLVGFLGPGRPEVWLAMDRDGATLGLASGPSALALRVLVEARDGDLWVHVAEPRGVRLPLPATRMALDAVGKLLSAFARREGTSFVLGKVAERIARALLPDAGARVPKADELRFVAVGAHGEAWLAHASHLGVCAEPSAAVLRAHEASAITRAVDDALAEGELDRARTLALDALERAPRHPALCRRIAEIDLAHRGRAEATLALYTERDAQPDELTGALEAELHVERTDVDAAVAVLLRTGSAEPVPALAARLFARAAELADDPFDAIDRLDWALARAPTLAAARWLRIGRRLGVGRIDDAHTDLLELEAQAPSAEAKHSVWREGATLWQRAGQNEDAARLFERALAFVPEDPPSIAGLGAALLVTGKTARGVALLERAVELGEKRGTRTHSFVIALARALGTFLDDRPSAIARLRAIADGSREGVLARGLEGRFRAQLGDVAGASLAFARLRDSASLLGITEGLAEVVELLLEAAQFEETVRGNSRAARELLATALRMAPHDERARSEFRRVGAIPPRSEQAAPVAVAAAALANTSAHEIAPESLREDAHGAPAEQPPDASDEAPDDRDLPDDRSRQIPGVRSGAFTLGLDSAHDVDAEDDDALADDEARVAELTQRLHGDPTNDAIVDELADRLARLGRGHELLALLSARLEEATPERRAKLVGPTKNVLERLAAQADHEGRKLEATLFRDMLSMIE